MKKFLGKSFKSVGKRSSNIIASLDQTMNAVGGGNRDTTISGRIYYNCNKSKDKYWEIMKVMVNFCFFGIDGKGHCRQAWENDMGEDYTDATFLDRIILFIPSFIICLIVLIITSPIAINRLRNERLDG